MNDLPAKAAILIRCAVVLFILAQAPFSKAQVVLGFQANAPKNANPKDALRQQIRRTFEPMLKVELSFAIRATEPSDEERAALIAGANKCLDQFADEFVNKQDRNQQRMLLQGARRVVIGGKQETDNPLEMIEAGVSKLVAETLPAPKVEAYEKETALRAAFRRDAKVANLVDQLDKRLLLSPEQREKITSSLIEHWDPTSAPQLEAFAYSNNFFRPVPAKLVLSELSDAQRTAFSKLNRTSQTFVVGGMGINGVGNDVIDDVDLEERPTATDVTPADLPADAADQDQTTN